MRVSYQFFYMFKMFIIFSEIITIYARRKTMMNAFSRCFNGIVARSSVSSLMISMPMKMRIKKISTWVSPVMINNSKIHKIRMIAILSERDWEMFFINLKDKILFVFCFIRFSFLFFLKRTREKEILMFDKVGLFKKERPKRIMIISMMFDNMNEDMFLMVFLSLVFSFFDFSFSMGFFFENETVSSFLHMGQLKVKCSP